MPPRLGVVAGGGVLPRHLVAAARRQARDVVVVAVEGLTDAATTDGVKHIWAAPGAFGRMIGFLKRSGARDVVLAGRASRPDWSSVSLDWRALRMLPRLLSADRGDDAVLSAAVRELEDEGFRVVAADAIAPELTIAPGVLGKVRVDATVRADIARGVAVLSALGPYDVGQAAVVQRGIVLGIEGAEGTDALIARCGALQRRGPGAVLVKCAKSGQDRRVDLPAIGPATVDAMAAAGLAGAAVEAGAALILERERTIEAADRARVFLCGIDPQP